ncbi:LysR family transcriptional regulator [Novosphingobium aquae]|uniref:LysR family transcriptional regulator n=1 Tax=Novosphingobium aquae TaxID=3133435 RepID=A0ABU8SCH7_9SPHN
METRYLRSFLKIAETGSITRAADSLGISQPSLSQQLLRLEDEAGVALFARTARGVTLTESGRRFLAHARSIIEGVNSALEDARQSGEDAVGEVILAAPYSISRIAGTALFEAMAERAPNVRFRLVEAMTAQIWGWLEEAKVDLGILNYLGPRRKLAFSHLASEELFLVGPPGEFGGLDGTVVVDVARLPELPLILPGFPHSLRQLIDQEAAKHRIGLQTYRDMDALAHASGLIAAGHGYSILPLSAVAIDVAAGRVSIARIGNASFRRQVSIARNSAVVITHASVICEKVVHDVLGDLKKTGTWVVKDPE